MRSLRRAVPFVLTAAFIVYVLQRIPYQRLVTALSEANYVWFLALVVPNALLYIAWDTLVVATAIRWFHGPVRYAELLPVRASCYIVSMFNSNVGRGALAVFLARLLNQPALQTGSTVIFLVLTEYTHMVLWGTIGILVFSGEATRPLLFVPPIAAGCWLIFFVYARAARAYSNPSGQAGSTTLRVLTAPWRGPLMHSFRLAPLRRYVQIVLLKAPMFFVSLCLYYFAAPSFGFHLPFGYMLTFLPVVFMVATLPITVTRFGTVQAAWVLLFGSFAPAERILAFSLAADLTFAVTRAIVGTLLLPLAYRDLAGPAARVQAEPQPAPVS
jgi:hypothetical protein